MAYVNLMQIIYPVGAVYLSYTAVSPSSLIGGTWTQITGRYLRAANDSATGGSDSVSHNFSHNHAMTLNQATMLGSKTFLTSQTGIGLHQGDAAIYSTPLLTSTSDGLPNGTTQLGPSSSSGGNQFKALGTVTLNIKPSYQNLYCYRRTA